MTKIKRVYDPPSRSDGRRVLVDRIWPRGLKRTDARLAAWMKELGPSTELRTWFGHDPDKWKEFRERFFRELDNRPEELDRLAAMVRKGTVTLVYGSREERFNNAAALKEYLEGRAASRHREGPRMRKAA